MRFLHGVSDDESGFALERTQDALARSLAKTCLVLASVGVFALAPAGVEAGDAASAPPAAVTPDGGRYWGPLVGGMRHGEGRVAWSDGSTYTGGFVDGMFSGKGHFKSPGVEYNGEFQQGHYWGKGELREEDGRSYRGEFVRGEFHGKGRYAIPDGPVYEGDFVRGKLHGHGVIAYPDGSRQEGQFRDWKADGPGKWTDEGGRTIEGEFKAGELQGVASSTSPDGTRYKGEMLNGMPNGQGELRHANGDVYRGGFRYGEYDGQGTLTYAKPQDDGRNEDSGLWQFGRFKKHVDEARRLAQANAERALYTQREQLQRALDALQPSSGSGINLYLLAVAGDGSQEVFRREVDFIRRQFDTTFATQGRSVALVNSRNTVGSSPLATLTSIREAVAAIAARMNRERDILFLYVTSHGSKEGTISLGLDGMRLPELSKSDLASVLKESGIRWKVVVLSACYAGTFMEPLKDPGTLVIAAARADRTSFGCADENEFTYFGRAFFKESLPSADSFEDAFARATPLIREWEDREAGARKGTKEPAAEDRYSLPQIDAPEPIRKHLKLWRDQLPKRSASVLSSGAGVDAAAR